MNLVRTPVAAIEAMGCVKLNVPLAPLTWYRLGGPARYFAEPRSESELAQLIVACRDAGVKTYPLGLGANLLVSDEGVDGCVIKLGGEPWRRVEAEPSGGGKIEATAAAGADLFKLVTQVAKRGYSGIECIAGIPGTIGGGVRMNAGGKFGDLGSRVTRLRVLDAGGTVRTLTREQAGFGYRQSALAEDDLVISATLRLFQDEPAEVQRRTKEVWDYKTESQPPMGKARSCGCAFTNPPGDSAGRLIDRAGCKGLRVGGAFVSEHHANFIVAAAGASSRDVSQLMDVVRRRVLEASGVALRPEVRRWPETDGESDLMAA